MVEAGAQLGILDAISPQSKEEQVRILHSLNERNRKLGASS